MAHKNLSDQINKNLEQSEQDGGVWLKDLRIGNKLYIQTRNTLYTLVKTGDEEYTLQGHPKYCPQPTSCKIAGSTWGGSMLKVGFIGANMHLEFRVRDRQGAIVTSPIQYVGSAIQVPAVKGVH